MKNRQMSKIVIYGAGVRGKRLAKFAGYSHIAAFVDGNKNLQGTKYQGIPIISFEEYREHYADYFVAVTPFVALENIEKLLKENGIYRVFYLRDCPEGFIDFDRDVLLGQFQEQLGDRKNIRLYGLTVFNIIFAEYLLENGYGHGDIKLVVPEEIDSRCLTAAEEQFSGLFFISVRVNTPRLAA